MTRNGRQVLVVPRDVRGVWPMVRHYFFFGPKPALTAIYNPLQKMAYSAVMLLAFLGIVTGFALYKPVSAVMARRCYGRFPDGAGVALRCDVRRAGVHSRPPADGGAAWLAEFRVDVDRGGGDEREAGLKPRLYESCYLKYQ